MRQKTHINRYESGASIVKKENTDLLNEITKLSKDLKNAQKGKETAVNQLNSFKIASAKRERELLGATSMLENGASKEAQQAKKLEATMRKLENEKKAAAEEAAKMRSAHTKILNTLMGYQEENSMLRSALEDLMDGGDGQPVLHTPAVKKVTSPPPTKGT